MKPILNTDSRLLQAVIRKSPKILMVLGTVGVISTVYWVRKKTPEANEKLAQKKEELSKKEVTPVETIVEEAKVVVPVYLPAIVTGGLTLACFWGSNYISDKRTLALASAYTLTDQTLRLYKEKTEEVVGAKKEQEIHEKVANSHVEKDPVSKHIIIDTGKGDSRCYDVISGRYFNTNIDKIKKAENVLNKRLMTEMYISLNDFYYEIGLPPIKIGDVLGWNVDRELIEFDFSSTLTDDGVPCIVIDYLVEPRADYRY